MKAGATRRPVAADRRKPILYITLAVVALALIVGVGLASRVPKAATETHARSNLKVGAPAPEFAVSTTAGPFDLATAKTPVFLEVFATWCPHCQRETAVIDGLYKKFGTRVSFVAVSGSSVGIDGNTPESQNDVLQFTQKFHVGYPVAFDPDLTVANAYLQSGFPTIAIIGTDKTVAYLGDGELSASTLDRALSAVR